MNRQVPNSDESLRREHAMTLLAINPVSFTSARVSERQDMNASLRLPKDANVRKPNHSALLKIKMDAGETRRIGLKFAAKQCRALDGISQPLQSNADGTNRTLPRFPLLLPGKAESSTELAFQLAFNLFPRNTWRRTVGSSL
jgi:hypothetical protein